MQQPQQPEALDPKLIDLIAKGRTAFHEGVSSPLENFILGIHFAFKDLSAPASPVGNHWVKASERLPKYPGSPQNHYRLDGEHKVHGNFHYSIDDERCEGEIVFTVIGMGLFKDYVIERDKFHALEWLEEMRAPLYSNEEFIRYKHALSAIRVHTLEVPYSSRTIYNIANAALNNSPAESKPSPVIEIGEQKGEIPDWFKRWSMQWLHKMECQGVDPKVREGFKVELEWAYNRIAKESHNDKNEDNA